MKHTKGKWLGGVLTDDGIILRNENCTRDIATVWRYNNEFLERQESEANAKLIACSPELLIALMEMVDIFDREHSELEQGNSIYNAKQLIIKATL
jgi:hypothetical protein